MIDRSAYLDRIGLAGEGLGADLDSLRALVVHHAAAIPFENLDPLAGRTPDLSAEGLQRKLIESGRGGYCFEHNLLFKAILEGLGFSVTGLAARVLWNQPEGAVTARGHMLLRVDDLPGGPHIVDVGFGGLTLTGVLRLEDDAPQPTPHEPFRLVPIGPGAYRMEAQVRGQWGALYRFDLQPQYAVDYEITNYYLATNPRSHFTSSLLAARSAPEARYALRNNNFAVHHRGGPSEQRTLESPREARAVLEEHFRLRLPSTPEFEAALARVLSR